MAKLNKSVIDAAEIRQADDFIRGDDLAGFGVRIFASNIREGKVSYV